MCIRRRDAANKMWPGASLPLLVFPPSGASLLLASDPIIIPVITSTFYYINFWLKIWK